MRHNRTKKTAKASNTKARIRIGIHTSISGRLELAAERAKELGCDAFQIFSTSPRTWNQAALSTPDAEAFRRRRYALGLDPLVVHDNYLINLASGQRLLRIRSLQAFRKEIERALALKADYLVFHPGSAVGVSRRQALANVTDSLRQAVIGRPLNGLQLLVENTAGQGNALGADLDELSELVHSAPELNLGVCIDTAHLFAAGYNIREPGGLDETLASLHTGIGLSRVKVIHVNDSKSACGSRVDRHEHIGKGKIGREAFRRLLRHPTLAGKTFILETPIEKKSDDRRNLQTLRRLAQGA